MYSEDSDDEDELVTAGNSYKLPDSVLLEVFRRLKLQDLVAAGATCKAWRQVARDEMLWKRLFHRRFKVDPAIGIRPGAYSWRREYRRLSHGAPRVQTQQLLDHSDQVLHVSFSHDGSLFATCSKDGYVLVWTSDHPCQLKYFHDMKRYRWKYTQFSQFNESDSMLLVSGVHFGTPHSTSGEIVIFSLTDGFTMRCRAMNKPYDVFGAWFGDAHFLSGELSWLAHLVSCSTLTVHRASQETHSELAPIMQPLFRFYNRNASTVRAVMVTTCVSAVTETLDSETPPPRTRDPGLRAAGNPVSHRDIVMDTSQMQQGAVQGAAPGPSWDPRFQDAIQYSSQYREAEEQACAGDEDVDEDEDSGGNSIEKCVEEVILAECEAPSACANVHNKQDCQASTSSDGTTNAVRPGMKLGVAEAGAAGEGEEGEEEGEEIAGGERLLIYATASKTYSPHQVAFKRVPSVRFPTTLKRGLSLSQRRAELSERMLREPPAEPNWLDFDSVAHRFTQPDEVIDLHGHIIGMGVSPDSRHLYVNVRAWPAGASVTNPLEPPPIAQEIDLHVVDLASLRLVGTLLRSHKAFTPNNDCFFIFLDVSHHFVASGAEDRQGYLWDRHYGALVARLPHGDVVNCVAFNPCDPAMLVSVSDDHSVRVWRSGQQASQLGLL